MQCDFDLDANGNGKCRRPGCGYMVRGAKGLVISECRSPETREGGESPAVSLLGMAISYVKAQVGHVLSGETVAQAEIDARAATCKPCDKHQAGRCVLCACMVSEGANPLTNKLAIAQPDWPVLKNTKGETIFECPQIARERARMRPQIYFGQDEQD